MDAVPPSIPEEFRQLQPCSSSTALDLSLITASVAISTIISFIPDARHISYAQRPLRTLFVTSVAFLSALVTSGILVTSLILGWTRHISLDALTGIMFAMAAALIRIPNILQDAGILYQVLRRPSLCTRRQRFRFIKLYSDRTCGQVGVISAEGFGGVCKGVGCEVRMFIRCFSSNRSQSLMDRIWGARSEVFPMRHALPQCPMFSLRLPRFRWINASPNSIAAWEYAVPGCHVQGIGTPVGHARNFVLSRNMRATIHAMWWQSISSSSHLALDPSKFLLTDKVEVLNALALISDILSIGHLVIELRKYYIKHLWEHDRHIAKAKTSSAGLTCSRLLKELGFHLWHDYRGMDMQNTVIPPEDNSAKSRRARCGILFCILADKSEMFSDNGQIRLHATSGPTERSTKGWGAWWNRSERRKSAQEILDEIIEAGNASEEEFQMLCEEKVNEWLIEWGCEPESLIDEEEIRKRLGVEP